MIYECENLIMFWHYQLIPPTHLKRNDFVFAILYWSWSIRIVSHIIWSHFFSNKNVCLIRVYLIEAMRWTTKECCTFGVVHLNSHSNKIISISYEVWSRNKQSNWRKSVPHGSSRIIIREVFFSGQVVTQFITESINAALYNCLKKTKIWTESISYYK